MTAEEIEELIESKSDIFTGNGGYCFEYLKPKDVREIIDQVKQQAVIEALEKEVPTARNEMQQQCVKMANNILKAKGLISVFDYEPKEGREYFEIQVKPKYEPNK